MDEPDTLIVHTERASVDDSRDWIYGTGAVERRSRSSVVERRVHIADVVGSNPTATTFTIPLTKGFYATLDKTDAHIVIGHCWQAKRSGRNWYAARSLHSGVLYLHRLIARPHAGRWVDHIDGNGLNNSRSNLRTCTPTQNLMNVGPTARSKTGVKGVFPSGDRFRSYISLRGKRVYLGTFSNVADAKAAYNKASIKAYGEFHHH